MQIVKIIDLLKLPKKKRAVYLDSLDTTLVHAEIINKKPFLKKISANVQFLLVCAILAVITFIVFENIRLCGFVYDDTLYVVENQHVITGLNIENIEWAFTDYISYWHPLTWISHMLDCQIFGVNAYWHHLTNLFFHILNTLLLFVFMKKVFGNFWCSFFVAALFSVHPLRVESVVWVAERKGLISTFFYILTLISYVHYVKKPRIGRYLITTIILITGLLAKPMVITLPFVMLLMDFWPLKRLPMMSDDASWNFQKADIEKTIRLLIEKIPFLILSVFLIGMWKFSTEELGSTISQSLSFQLRTENALVSYIIYLRHIFWPAGLGVFYPYPKFVPMWHTVCATIILVSVTLGALNYFRTKPYLLFGWLWFLGTLVPVLGFLQSGTWPQTADRFSYLPSIGILIMVAFGLQDILSGWKYKKTVLCFSGVSVIAVLMICTHTQVKYWTDELSLFKRTLDVTENNYIIHNNYGYALYQTGKTDLAVEHYKKSLEIDPDYTSAINNLGTAMKDMGNIPQAVELWEKVLKLDPDNAPALFNLALLMSRKGQYDKAIEYCNKSLQSKPDNRTYSLLGFVYQKLSKYNLAIQNYEQALRLKPDLYEVYFNLAGVYSEVGRLDDAIRTYKQLIEIKPEHPGASNNLGIILKEAGRSKEAIEAWEKALQIQPPDLHIHFNVGRAMFEQEEYEKSVEHLQKALTAYPDWIEIYEYLGHGYYRLGKHNLSIQNYSRLLQHKPGQVDVLNKLAWILATNENDKLKNPAKAVKYAQQACKLTDFNAPELLDTLAVAYAAAGRFADAVATANKALQLPQSPQKRDLIQKRLDLYRQKIPYIDPYIKTESN